MKKTLVIAAIVAGSTAATVFAHGGATGIVKERMDAMANMGKAMKSITPMMQGTAAYDAGAVKRAAAVFEKHSGEAMTKLFPEGTGGKPSEAKDVVWNNWAEFSELAEQLSIAAKGLSKAADNGLMGSGAMSSGNMMGGNSGMMGSSGMMGGGMMPGAMNAEHIGSMPADGAFAMVAQTCSACHSKFRAESK